MTLADRILPLVRTRTDLHRWRASNEYGIQLHDAVSLLQDAAENEPPAEVLAVTQKAIASACKLIMRADDSSGIIGDASEICSSCMRSWRAPRRRRTASSSTG